MRSRRMLALAASLVLVAGLAHAIVAADAQRIGTVRARVTRVVDGETVAVRIGSRSDRVRILGIDTPAKGQCFGAEAATQTKQLALGKTVELVGDKRQPARDRTGRILAYVDLANGRDLGRLLIAGGFAKVDASRPFARLAAYRQSELAAKNAARGLWGRCSGLRVAGNRLLDRTGQPVHLHGVNYAGTEYTCVHGYGIFDGPSDAAAVAAIASWHSNIVRIPLNEDCWLGINGVKPAYAGANYRAAIVGFVKLLASRGLYAELSLMWGAPGTNTAGYQPAAPDADHSPAMWSSLAATFKDNPNVILAPWGETTVSADCFLRGGNCGATWGNARTPYASAGMQQAVDVMRQAGYTGPIAIPGIKYANDLSQWLAYEPRDPLHQLVAEAHVYGKNTCDDTGCFDRTIAPVAARVPVIFGETGETYDASDCGSSYISTFLTWADAHGVGYAAWTWNTWGNCSSLISKFDGTPANAYGAWVRSHYVSLP